MSLQLADGNYFHEINESHLLQIALCHFLSLFLPSFSLSALVLLPLVLMTSTSIDFMPYLSTDFRYQFFTFHSNIMHAKIYSSFDLRSVRLLQTLNRMKNCFACPNSNHEFFSKECQFSPVASLMESTTDQFQRISRVTLFSVHMCDKADREKNHNKFKRHHLIYFHVTFIEMNGNGNRDRKPITLYVLCSKFICISYFIRGTFFSLALCAYEYV